MIELFDVAKRLIEFLDQHDIPNVVIGGLTVGHWGEPRITTDVDLSILTGFVNEEAVIDLILSEFQGRIPTAKSHALDHRVLLLEVNGIGVDIGLAGFPYEEAMFQRAVPLEYLPGYTFNTLSASDLIIMKTFAGRERDWLDVRGIIIRQQDRLDWLVIDSALTELLDLIDDPTRLDRLHKIRQEEADLDAQEEEL